MRKFIILSALIISPFISPSFAYAEKTLDQYYDGFGVNRTFWASSNNQSQTQGFVPTHNAKILEIKMKICKQGSPNINPYITLNSGTLSNPSNNVLSTSNVVDIQNVPSCSAGTSYVAFEFESDNIFEANSIYWIVLKPITYLSASNYIRIEGGSTNQYQNSLSFDGGTWISNGHSLNFYEYYDSTSEVYKINGNVFHDYNKNGLKDPREPNYTGATITLSGSASNTTQTDSGGNYMFTNLSQGSYSITITTPEGFTDTTTNPVPDLTGNTTVNFGLASPGTTLTILDTNIGEYGDGFIECGTGLQANVNKWPSGVLYATTTPKVSFIKFNLSQIPPGSIINTASISYLPSYMFNNPIIYFYRVNKNIELSYLNALKYSQSGTWTNPCTYSMPYLRPDDIASTAMAYTNASGIQLNSYNKLNLTVSEFQSMLAANNGIAIMSNAGGINFHSANQPNPPYLTVSYADVTNTPTPTNSPTPTTTPTPTYTPTPTPLPTYSISGTVYRDINENGFRDEGEAGYENAEIQLSSGQTATTDANGSYVFTDITTGMYETTLTMPSGYFATTTNPANISLTADTTQNFGITTPHNQPTTTAVLAPNPDLQGEYPNPVAITLQVSADTGYNIVNTYYAIDNGPQQIYIAPFVVSGAGSHIISYWSIDNANKEEMPHPVSTFAISSTATDAQISAGQATTDIGNGITISGNATSSGYVTVTPSSNNNGGPVPAQFKILNTFYEISSTAQFTFPITLTFQYPTNNPNQNLKVMHYTGSSWEQLDTVLSYNSSTQIMTLTATANSLSPFAIVELDETAPIITDFNLSAYIVQNGGTSTITAKATDDLTGVSSLSYTLTSSTGQTTNGNMDFISPSGQWYDAIIAPSTGVYSVKLIARDQAGNEAVSETKYLAVYDPSAGHVTGGGWIVPDNATRTGVSANGKLNFGFVAKYINGIPNGNLTINYKNDNLEFKSTSLEWLTVSDSIADFQGQVALNGAGNYTFRAHIIDGSSDNFDIRIWDVNDSFENPTYRLSNELSGGSIKIHQ